MRWAHFNQADHHPGLINWKGQCANCVNMSYLFYPLSILWKLRLFEYVWILRNTDNMVEIFWVWVCVHSYICLQSDTQGEYVTIFCADLYSTSSTFATEKDWAHSIVERQNRRRLDPARWAHWARAHAPVWKLTPDRKIHENVLIIYHDINISQPFTTCFGNFSNSCCFWGYVWFYDREVSESLTRKNIVNLPVKFMLYEQNFKRLGWAQLSMAAALHPHWIPNPDLVRFQNAWKDWKEDVRNWFRYSLYYIYRKY